MHPYDFSRRRRTSIAFPLLILPIVPPSAEVM
jgi:hypothetical protein